MAERLFLPGRFTDLTDPRQLGVLNGLLTQLLAVFNSFDQNSFALAWIAGAAAGQVITSRGTGNAPEWDAAPTLTGATFSGLTASQMVQTTAAKALVSMAPSSAYTVTNPTTDRALNVTGDTLAQGLAVLGTVIADLQAAKILG